MLVLDIICLIFYSSILAFGYHSLWFYFLFNIYYFKLLLFWSLV